MIRITLMVITLICFDFELFYGGPGGLFRCFQREAAPLNLIILDQKDVQGLASGVNPAFSATVQEKGAWSVAPLL